MEPVYPNKYIVHKYTLECLGAYRDPLLLPFIIPEREQFLFEYIESTLLPEQCVCARRNELGNIELYVDEIKLEEYKQSELVNIRSKRNALLAETDYCVLPDTQLSAEQLNEIKVYRQELRDITKTIDILNPIFPTKPLWFKSD